jgi:hypothetical protein
MISVIMDTTILMKGIISIFTYWLQFNILFILCDLDIVTNTTNNILGLNQTNGKSNNRFKLGLFNNVRFGFGLSLSLSPPKQMAGDKQSWGGYGPAVQKAKAKSGRNTEKIWDLL